MKKYSFLQVTVLLLCISCNGRQEYNPFDAEIHYVTPEVTDTIYGTPVCTLFTDGEPMEYILSAVYDSLLILETYKVERLMAIADLNTGNIIGKYIDKGRGPGELLSVTDVKCFRRNDSIMVTLYDMTGQDNFVELNVTEMMTTGKPRFRQLGKIIPVTLKACEWTDSSNLYYRLDDNYLKLQEIDKSGTRLGKSYNLFPDIPATQASIMSFGMVLNSNALKVCIAMVGFPELNFLDMDTGERMSVVYDEKLDFKKIFDLFVTQYRYPEKSIGNVFDTVDAICLYTVDECVDDLYAVDFLIFDWDGNFKCRLMLNENCKQCVFDSENKLLYAVIEDDVLYRYDLSKYFEKF